MYYKTFYGRNLRIFVISYIVCPWQAFPVYSNVCELRLHSMVGSWPQPQTLGTAGNAWRGQTLAYYENQ